MKRPKRDPVREDHIFPFQAKCLATKVVSPLRKGESVEVVHWRPDEICEHDMLVLVRWQGRKLAVPLAQLTAVDLAQGYCF